MNYQGLIKQIWKYNEKEPLGAVTVAFYLFLLEQWVKNEENDFNLSDSEICKKLKITRPTINILRQKLSNLRMIQYQPRNGLPGYYKISMEYSPVSSTFEKSEKRISKKKKTAEKPEQKRKNIQKQELISDNKTLSSNTFVENLVSTPIPENLPSLEEFMLYAETLENYIPELVDLIKVKYDSWLGNGWKNGYGKPITNWKSSLKNIMVFLQNELHSGATISPKIILQTIKRPKSNFD